MGLLLKKRPLALALLSALALMAGTLAQGALAVTNAADLQTTSVVLAFSGPSPEWKDLTFPGIKRHTRYIIINDPEGAYLMAMSKASASALYMALDLDAEEFPVISWRWKINGVLNKGDARSKAGDDYAARVYVTFARDPASETIVDEARDFIAENLFGQSVPGSALNYIWATRLEKGAITPNPYTAKSMMVAVESGNAKAGRWVKEARNIVEDYKKAFGRRPPRITGIAVMTDSDNTGEEATAWYGKIVFRRKTGHSER